MKILVVNGPNMDLLGVREPAVYGTKTLSQLEDALEEHVHKNMPGVTLIFGRSNSEGEIINLLNSSHGAYEGLVINPAGLSYSAYALRDSVKTFSGVKVEVHLTNIFAREPYRRNDIIAEVVDGFVCGLGWDGYKLAIEAVVRMVKQAGKATSP
jgi:3-dehydroquinate dehydratase II